jgi:hypothetical protein
VKRRFICLVQIKGERMILMESFTMDKTIENKDGKRSQKPRSSHLYVFVLIVGMTRETNAL